MNQAASHIRIPQFFSKLPKLPFANFVNVVPNGERWHATQIPHYILRLTSHKTAERHIVMLRFDGVTWESQKYDEKVVVELLAGWLKELVDVAGAQDETETFELMPSFTRWTMGGEEKKNDVKEDEFLRDEAKKMFQVMAAYTNKKTQFMGHLGPRMSVHTGGLDRLTPTFSIDGSWNVSSTFSISALDEKSVADFRKDAASASNPYHNSHLAGTTVVGGRICGVQVRDDVLGDLFPRMVDRQSVTDEINKTIASWVRAGFGADCISGVALNIDWIERNAE